MTPVPNTFADLIPSPCGDVLFATLFYSLPLNYRTQSNPLLATEVPLSFRQGGRSHEDYAYPGFACEVGC